MKHLLWHPENLQLLYPRWSKQWQRYVVYRECCVTPNANNIYVRYYSNLRLPYANDRKYVPVYKAVPAGDTTVFRQICLEEKFMGWFLKWRRTKMNYLAWEVALTTLICINSFWNRNEEYMITSELKKQERSLTASHKKIYQAVYVGP